jgi:hypothetical protein
MESEVAPDETVLKIVSKNLKKSPFKKGKKA